MPPDDRKRSYRREMLLATAMVAAGLIVSGLSLADLAVRNPQVAQATPPLQSTPDAETRPSKPPEPATTGTRPAEIAPQPASPMRRRRRKA